jgi:hypothetical protein
MRTPLTNCPTKAKSRVKSIIEPWKTLTGQDSVPANECYVTLCGPMSGGNGYLFPHCELLHLVREKFIEPEQFHGIERDETVWRNNVSAVERTFGRNGKPCLHEPEDLIAVLGRLLSAKTRIAVLNIDLQVGPKAGIRFLTRALSMLNTMPEHPALVIWNVLVKSPYRGRDMTPDLEVVLRGDPRFQRARARGQWVSPRQVRYRRAHTTMHSLILCRQGVRTDT